MTRFDDLVFPRWLFSILAMSGWVACGIYIGIMSIEGITFSHILPAAGFGFFGGLMMWGAVSPR